MWRDGKNAQARKDASNRDLFDVDVAVEGIVVDERLRSHRVCTSATSLTTAKLTKTRGRFRVRYQGHRPKEQWQIYDSVQPSRMEPVFCKILSVHVVQSIVQGGDREPAVV